jgi:hypothetical protein
MTQHIMFESVKEALIEITIHNVKMGNLIHLFLSCQTF